MTTAASHQYLPLGCPTTLPSAEEQSHRPDLSRIWRSGLSREGGQVSSATLPPAGVPSFIHPAPVFIVTERLPLTRLLLCNARCIYKWFPDSRPHNTPLSQCYQLTHLN